MPNRPEPPVAGDETATLLGFLEYQRATLAWKCGDLDAAGLRWSKDERSGDGVAILVQRQFSGSLPLAPALVSAFD